MGAADFDTNVSDVVEGGMDHNLQTVGDEVRNHLVHAFVKFIVLFAPYLRM